METITIIKNKAQYEEYLKRFKNLFDCEEDSLEEQELEMLALVIEKYENENFHIPVSDPINTIKFLMEQNNMTRKDIAIILKSESRATEVLNKQRRLSLHHIRLINKKMRIPAETLIQEYSLNLT